MKKGTKLSILASAAAIGLASCASDELKEVYQGDDITFSTRVTRATPTTLSSLDGFYVYADAGAKFDGLFLKGDSTKKDVKNGNIYNFSGNKVMWPSGVDQIRFWAYGPLNAKKWLTPKFSQSMQLLEAIEVKSDLVENDDLTDGKPHLDNSGAGHKDLVVAYAEATRQGSQGMQVNLQFHHAFSQIEVHLKKGAGFEEGRVVKVKGAWIVNAHSRGTVEFDQKLEEKNYMNWSTNYPVSYGHRLENGERLGNIGVDILYNDGHSNNSSLMLLPQKFTKYVFDKDKSEPAAVEEPDNTDDNIHNNNTAGTYILILCRVETEHRYKVDGTDPNTAIGDLIENGVTTGHVHQLFPISRNDKGETIYDGEAYGYTCIPIEGEWIAGKRYVYTLEFCGKNSGAGLYPPEPLPDVFPEETPRGDPDKGPGDPVLDDPITFSVTVSDWNTDENTENKGELMN